ncbi:MAG: hypothetical protein D6160_18135 [Ketobacter sp.]|nr:MAG: hypothetical protein D6160_18135 [Ketobacter sp.]
MSYHLTIVRSKGKKQDLVSEQEIFDLINQDSRYSFEDKGNYLNIKKTPKFGEDYYFIYQNGELWIKNPEPAHIEQFIELANILGGRVRGDELETYKAANETYFHPDDKSLIEQAKQISRSTKRRRNKRQILINGGIFAFFLVLALFVIVLGKE